MKLTQGGGGGEGEGNVKMNRKTNRRKKKALQAPHFKHFKRQTERQRQIPEMTERTGSKGQGLRRKVQRSFYQ